LSKRWQPDHPRHSVPVDVSLSSWFIILLAAVAANLPFLNERLFAFISLGKPIKSFWLRLVELIALYFLVRGVAYLLESNIGNVFPQRWEFYAVTACLFIVFAFPGFVFRYLRKRHG
jgi:hypothetical protein